MSPALPLAVLLSLSAFSGETGAPTPPAEEKKPCAPAGKETGQPPAEKPGQPAAEEKPCQPPDPSEALINLPGSVFVRNEKGQIMDMRFDPPRPVEPGQAEEVYTTIRLRINDMQQRQERGEKITDPGEAALARLLKAPKKGLLAGPGAGQAGGDVKARIEAAQRVPRAQSRVSLAKLPAPPRRQAEALKTELDGLYKQFDEKLDSSGFFGGKYDPTEWLGMRPGLGAGWAGNFFFGHTCQIVHDNFKGEIQERKLAEKYPGMEFVTLYQPGYKGGARFNHVFIGVRDRNSGQLTHYYDPWSGVGMTPYEGKGSLPVSREKLILHPWEKGRSYHVDDKGYRQR